MMSALDRKDLWRNTLEIPYYDLSKITLAQAADLKNFCIAEETIMTNIVMVDLYHVIGMGNLTPTDDEVYLSIQEYLEYRPTLLSSLLRTLIVYEPA